MSITKSTNLSLCVRWQFRWQASIQISDPEEFLLDAGYGSREHLDARDPDRNAGRLVVPPECRNRPGPPSSSRKRSAPVGQHGSSYLLLSTFVPEIATASLRAVYRPIMRSSPVSLQLLHPRADRGEVVSSTRARGHESSSKSNR